MYHLTSTSRTLSSGFESTFKKSFATLEEAATYIHDVWYDDFCEDFEFPLEWDEEDRGCAFPKKEEFTPEAIKSRIGKKRKLVLIEGYSQYAALVPNEVVLEFY
jgi:hypothetical protein